MKVHNLYKIAVPWLYTQTIFNSAAFHQLKKNNNDLTYLNIFIMCLQIWFQAFKIAAMMKNAVKIVAVMNKVRAESHFLHELCFAFI